MKERDRQIKDSIKEELMTKNIIDKSIDARIILTDYNNNRISADLKYKNKNMDIFGVVTSIDRIGGNSKAYVQMSYPIAYFRTYNKVIGYSDAESLVGFNVGDKVYISGKFRGVDEKLTDNAVLHIDINRILTK